MSRHARRNQNQVTETSEAPVVENQTVDQVITTEQAKPVETPAAPQFDIPALYNEYKSKSALIRYLHAQGQTVAQIHKMLVSAGFKSEKSGEPIRYQHVRNVIKQPVKKASTVAPSAPAAPVTQMTSEDITA